MQGVLPGLRAQHKSPAPLSPVVTLLVHIAFHSTKWSTQSQKSSKARMRYVKVINVTPEVNKSITLPLPMHPSTSTLTFTHLPLHLHTLVHVHKYMYIRILACWGGPGQSHGGLMWQWSDSLRPGFRSPHAWERHTSVWCEYTLLKPMQCCQLTSPGN